MQFCRIIMLECVSECACPASCSGAQEKFVNYPRYWKYCNNINIVRIWAIAETCINTEFADMVHIIYIIWTARIMEEYGYFRMPGHWKEMETNC